MFIWRKNEKIIIKFIKKLGALSKFFCLKLIYFCLVSTTLKRTWPLSTLLSRMTYLSNGRSLFCPLLYVLVVSRMTYLSNIDYVILLFCKVLVVSRMTYLSNLPASLLQYRSVLVVSRMTYLSTHMLV